ncbi:MAG: GntR family transcriptional regulator [Clostridiales bacterium]|jgi:DNA-binding transcriptional regulator YhcF (GntR family)|nr:GntR family transcriptional regulator [Clostridiales bacterium]
MDDSRPVFLQIMEIIENGIIGGIYRTDELVISTTQISRLYNVNPATAVKAISRLAEDGILYKRPGIGMCVAAGARDKIVGRRKAAFFGKNIDEFLAEAKTLNISTEELIRLIKERASHD